MTESKNLTFLLGCLSGSRSVCVLYFRSTIVALDSCPYPPMIIKEVLFMATVQCSYVSLGSWNRVNALHFPGFRVLSTSMVFNPGSLSSAAWRLNRRERKKDGEVTNLLLPMVLPLKSNLLRLKLLPTLLRTDSVGKRVLGNLRPPMIRFLYFNTKYWAWLIY